MSNLRRLLAALTATGLGLGGCVTAKLEDSKQATTGISSGESIVVMPKSYHLGNETERSFTECIGQKLTKGSSGLSVMPNEQFVDALFPWFEPRTAPTDTKSLPKLMQRPGVAERIAETGVRYIVWLDGTTDRTGGGGSLSCAAGPGGGGCFGFTWWETDADYEASVWDLKRLENAGSVSAEVSGTSYMPAIVIPIPLIARTQTAACTNLADSLQAFITGDEST
ncbi:MAG: hypothetical protein AAGH76_14430 [Pseudomonadota bacterium]